MGKDNFKWLVLLSAMAIVGMSGYYSVFGISSLFAGKRLFAGIMAGSLEVGKIVTTTHLTRNWKKIGNAYKTYFIIATVILIIISSAGIYSYLTEAYHLTAQKMKVVDTELGTLSSEEQSLVSEKELLIQDRNSSQEEINSLRILIDNNETRKTDLYRAMNADTTGTVNWNASIWKFNKDNGEYRENISDLRDIKQNATLRITDIDVRLKEIWTQSGKVETSDEASNIGPLKKLSELFDVDMDTIVKFFIFILIIVFDPLGILLIVQFNKMTVPENITKYKKNERMKEKTIYTGVDVENKKIKDKNNMEKINIQSYKVPDEDDDYVINVDSAVNKVVSNETEIIEEEIIKNKIDNISEIVNIESISKEANVPKSDAPSFKKDVSHKGIRVS